ncbi:hypothetical protein Aperf_G00000010202 [Anoplocephala perfoliata]
MKFASRIGTGDHVLMRNSTVQLSTWLRSTYESANGTSINPQLQQLQRNLKSVLNTCVGLDLTSVIAHYRKLLNECQGCENGLDSVNFDEATIEAQILQLLEQTAAELGQDIRLYDRLGKLSRKGSLDQLTSSTSAAVAGSTQAQAEPPQASSGAVKPHAPPMQRPTPVTVGSGIASRSSAAPITDQTNGFPNFPGTETIISQSVIAAVATAASPVAPKPRVSIGQLGSGQYQTYRPYGGPPDLPTDTTSLYSNLGASPGRPPKTSTSRLKTETAKEFAPVPPPIQSVEMPPLPHESNESEFPEHLRPLGLQAEDTNFRQSQPVSTRAPQTTAPTVVKNRPQPKPVVAPRMPIQEQYSSPNSFTRYQPSETIPPPKEPTTATVEPRGNIQNGSESQQLMKMELDSAEQARSDNFEGNISTSFTDLGNVNDAPEILDSIDQEYTGLTDVAGGQKDDGDKDSQDIEVQPLSSLEPERPVKIEQTDLETLENTE